MVRPAPHRSRFTTTRTTSAVMIRNHLLFLRVGVSRLYFIFLMGTIMRVCALSVLQAKVVRDIGDSKIKFTSICRDNSRLHERRNKAKKDKNSHNDR